MAKNRDSVKQVESQSDSGESEDEEVSSEESESESEQPQTAAQTKSQPQPAVKPPPPPFSSDEEESETESESDEPDSNAKPPASKPIEKAQKSTDQTRVARSKPSRPDPVTPTKSAAAKRPSEDTPGKDAKKAKKTETPEKKSNLFQRLWSEEDEIVILKGMIDYAAKNKSDPLSDLNDFHDFIKNNLHLDFSRTQLQNKIRRLKKKYRNNKSKEEEGKERSFSKSHEQSVYDLSKEIWGKESGEEKIVGSSKTNGSLVKRTPNKGNGGESGEIKGVKNGIGEGDKSLQNLNCDYTGGSIEERMFQSGREMYEVGEGVEEEEEWKRLKVEELELYLKQLEVRIAQTKLVLNGMKARDY